VIIGKGIIIHHHIDVYVHPLPRIEDNSTLRRSAAIEVPHKYAVAASIGNISMAGSNARILSFFSNGAAIRLGDPGLMISGGDRSSIHAGIQAVELIKS
jgi:serine acetyltransferase